MKATLVLSALLAGAETALAASLPLRIISFNIRYDASSRETNEKPWWDILCGVSSDRCRMPHVIKLLSDAAAAPATADALPVIGLQEVLDNQLSDVKKGLGDSWDHVGVGRDDGKTKGEYSPILYRTDKLRVVFSETKWLSPTPDEVSFGWGAGSRRVVTLAVFEETGGSGRKFIHANTHLDNVSSQARSEGVKVVLARIKAAQDAYGPLGVSLTGDFNSAVGQDAFKTLDDSGYMKELFDLATPEQHAGTNQLTYTGFSDTGISRIDFIWLGPVADKAYSVQKYEILNNKVGSVYASDHRPVVGDVTLV